MHVFIDLYLCLYQDLHKVALYLPLLENLFSHTKEIGHSQMLQWNASLKIRWSSALSSSSIFWGLKFFQIDHLVFELSMTLFLYGAILRERALEVLSAGMHQRLCPSLQSILFHPLH